MRTLPVNAAAIAAAVKSFEINARLWRKLRQDLGLGYGLDLSITLNAKRERPDVLLQAKVFDHLPELLLWVRRPYPVSPFEAFIFKQTFVAGQHDPALTHSRSRDLFVREHGLVTRIEAEQPQVPHQFPQVRINDKAERRRLGLKVKGASLLERMIFWINADLVAFSELTGKIARSFVHKNGVDRHVRHANGFQGILDRRAAFDRVGETPVPARDIQKIPELAEKPDMDDVG
jgi:hypothetical protein